MPASCHEQSSALGINFQVKRGDLSLNGIIGQEIYLLEEVPGFLFCFPLLKILTLQDEPSVYKPWTSSLAEFLFLFVSLGCIFPLVSQKMKEKQELAGCCESIADLWPSEDWGGLDCVSRVPSGEPPRAT